MVRQVEVKGVVNSSDNKQAHIVTDDPKSSYTIVNPEAGDDYNPAQVEWVDPCMVDYNYRSGDALPSGLPASFLQINTVAEGTEWYKHNSKYPDLVCEMLAKYEWGDLRHTTQKEFKNQKKKVKKRAKKVPGPALLRSKGAFKVTFE